MKSGQAPSWQVIKLETDYNMFKLEVIEKKKGFWNMYRFLSDTPNNDMIGF